jgi:hypothetical protein
MRFVTLGTRLLEATVEYGSALTKVAATQVADAYLLLNQGILALN